MKGAVILLFVLIVIYCQKSPDQFTIDLSLPPLQRYQQLAKIKKEHINRFIDFLHTDQKYRIAFGTAKAMSLILRQLVGGQFYEECLGIARTIGRHVSELVVFNYMYQLGAYSNFCTSIAVQSGDGYFLARNLDYGFQEYLADNSVKLTYIRNSRTIFQTIGHAGLIGAHTGLRIDGYSVTLNQRIDAGLHKTIQEILIHRSHNVPYLLQQTLRNAENIQQAFEKLLNTRVCAAVYFILNSQGRNILIEKQRRGAKAVYENKQFIVQTNTDRDQSDPDTRRDVAEAKMNSLYEKNQTSVQNVWKILTSPPNKNKLTLITVVLNTKENIINATVWTQFQ